MAVEQEEVTTAAVEPAVKPAETYLVATVASVEEVTVTEPAVAETEAPAVKPVDSYLVSDVVDVRTDDNKTDEVETEAPVIKPDETYLVEEEITTYVPVESEAVTTEAAVEAVETEAPAIKPAETYLVAGAQITASEIEESAAALNSIVEEEVLNEELTTQQAQQNEEANPIENASAPEEEVLAIETVSNPLELVEVETLIQTKPSNGYWIEVSGDKDALVQYHG